MFYTVSRLFRCILKQPKKPFPTFKRGRRFPSMGWSYSDLAKGENLEHVLQHVVVNDDGFFQVKDGSFRFLSNNFGNIFEETNGKWEINDEYVESIRRDGIQIPKETKIFHCQPLDDPVTGPNSEIIRETTERMFEGSDVNIGILNF